MNQRTELLLGEEKQNQLKSKNILIVGVGGVGGYVCELLARCGIQNMTIADFDIVDKSNLNRQIFALNSTIGTPKVDAAKERLMDINPEINLRTLQTRLSPETIYQIFNEKFDMVVDAIDDTKNKTFLIEFCHKNNIECVSALGSGNRAQIPIFEVTDLSKTENDGLAKKIRLELRNRGINHHTVVYSKQDRVKVEGNTIGSISYFPSMCGCVIAGYVVNKLLEEK